MKNTYSTERGFSFQLMVNSKAVEGFVTESSQNFVLLLKKKEKIPQNSLTMTSTNVCFIHGTLDFEKDVSV